MLLEPADSFFDAAQFRLEGRVSGHSIDGSPHLGIDPLLQLFELFLRDVLELDEPLVERIVAMGWGLAGRLEGDRVIATKIPKSGYLLDYLQETDPEKKRQYYCHCPRVRDVLRGGETISTTYCYCGAGFYKGIWQEILQRSVEVEVLESVLQGDAVCKIAIYLGET